MNTHSVRLLEKNHDEIDLFEIMHYVWTERYLVLASTFIVVIIAFIYCMAVPKLYETSSLLRPTAINDLDALNRSEVYKLPPMEALDKVGLRLQSYDARLNFFKSNPKLFEPFQKPGQSLEQGFESFNREGITLDLPDPKKTDNNRAIKLQMQYPEGIDGVAIANNFIDYALELEREEISADLKVIIENRLSEVREKIAAAKSNYETEKESKIALLLENDTIKRAQLQDELQGLRLQMKVARENRISELGEAISIAKVMGIKRPTTPSSLSSSNQIMRTEVNNQTIPLYFMGTDALEAERTALKNRKSDDFANSRIAEISKDLKILNSNREVEILNQRKNEDIFLQNIDPLRAERSRLRSINTDMKNLNLVAIDRRAQEPLGPIKPRKALIMGMSIVMGLMLGVILALFRQTVLNRRNTARLKVLEAPLTVNRDTVEK